MLVGIQELPWAMSQLQRIVQLQKTRRASQKEKGRKNQSLGKLASTIRNSINSQRGKGLKGALSSLRS